MKLNIRASLFVFLLIPLILTAQTADFGIWSSIGIDKSLRKWDLGAQTELRTNDNSGQINRLSFSLAASYNLIKPLKIGTGYEYIYFHDVKFSDYQPRQRYIVYAQGEQKLGNFKFTLREKIQRTIKDESDRIIETGKYDNYKINPEYIWRNRLNVAYNIPQFPVTPSLSFETFYQLNNPDGNAFNQFRTMLSFKYKLTKQNEFKIYGLIDKEINVVDAAKIYVVGFEYTFSF
jgi:hypothetical protein